MRCAWKELLSLLPQRMREAVDRRGREGLLELRLRINAPPELVLTEGSVFLQETVSESDLSFVVNAASRYSPWCSSSSAQGFLTAPGGHRIGICGEAVMQDGNMTGFREIRSLCLRVARDHPGIASALIPCKGSMLILGAPGWGKTTLMRDLCRSISQSQPICVVDERGELFPEGFAKGLRMDVLSGCPKAMGIEMVLRTMTPQWIAVDEITAEADCHALTAAANCSVQLLATAHGACREDLYRRPIYRYLLEQKVFQYIVLMKRDRSYQMERMAS